MPGWIGTYLGTSVTPPTHTPAHPPTADACPACTTVRTALQLPLPCPQSAHRKTLTRLLGCPPRPPPLYVPAAAAGAGGSQRREGREAEVRPPHDLDVGLQQRVRGCGSGSGSAVAWPHTVHRMPCTPRMPCTQRMPPDPAVAATTNAYRYISDIMDSGLYGAPPPHPLS